MDSARIVEDEENTAVTTAASNDPQSEGVNIGQLWTQLKKMHHQKLRNMPLDALDVLRRGSELNCSVELLETQEKTINTYDQLDKEFTGKIFESLAIRCDCCDQSFEASENPIRDMLDHIRSQEHYDTLVGKLNVEPNYMYNLHKSVGKQALAEEAKKKKGQQQKATKRGRGDDNGEAAEGNSSKKKKIEKHPDVPEDLRPMADWTACYICNISCSSDQIYQMHAAGKRHQKILALSPEHLQNNPSGPYVLNGKPTINLQVGAIKIAVDSTGQPHLVQGNAAGGNSGGDIVDQSIQTQKGMKVNGQQQTQLKGPKGKKGGPAKFGGPRPPMAGPHFGGRPPFMGAPRGGGNAYFVPTGSSGPGMPFRRMPFPPGPPGGGFRHPHAAYGN